MKYLTEKQWQAVKDKAIELYIEQKRTIKETAKEVNLAYSIVHRRLKKLGLLRTASEARKISLRQGKANWKGGRVKSKGGYIKVLAPDHPRARKDGYVLEHILVWEEYHQKQLPEDWIIHHLNRKRDDNRPENLFAMPRRCHRMNLLLEATQKRVRALETQIKYLKARRQFNENPIAI